MAKPEITMMKTDALIPYARNPRTHSDIQVGQIAASIKEFGWLVPVVVDSENVLIAGHGRVLAAQKLGLDRVPTIDGSHLTPAQAKAFRIAENKLQLNAGWDDELLRVELEEMVAKDYGIDFTGFSEEEIADLLGTGGEGKTDPDDAPEIQKEAVSKTGDLWRLGLHRVLCGDATKADDVVRLMAGEKATLFATDPPYLVDYTGGDRPNDSGKDWSMSYHEIDIGNAEEFFKSVFMNASEILIDHSAWYCWHAHKRAALIERIWDGLGILNHQQIIWVKPGAIHSYSFYPWQHEPCLFGWRKGCKPNHDGDKSHAVTSVWTLDWEGAARIIGNDHPTQKPIEIFARPMRKHTAPNAICYEPFAGSGSQIIAGEREGRQVFALEIEPLFVDVTIRRWQDFTGKEATLDGEEITFSQAAEAVAAS